MDLNLRRKFAIFATIAGVMAIGGREAFANDAEQKVRAAVAGNNNTTTSVAFSKADMGPQAEAPRKVISKSVGNYVTYDLTGETNKKYLEDAPFSASNDRIAVLLHGGNDNVKGAAQFASEQFAARVHGVSYLEMLDNDTNANTSLLVVLAEGREFIKIKVPNNASPQDIADTLYSAMLGAYKEHIEPYLAAADTTSSAPVVAQN